MNLVKSFLFFVLCILIIIGAECVFHKEVIKVKHGSNSQITVTSNVSDGEPVPTIKGYATGVPARYREKFLLCEESVQKIGVPLNCY